MTAPRFLLALGLCLLLSAASDADIIEGKDGFAIQGDIESMSDSKVRVKTDMGTHDIDLADIQSFKIDRAASAASLPAASAPASAAIAGGTELLEVLKDLALSIANLEKRVQDLQSSQRDYARQLNDRTLELNPEKMLVVKNARLHRKASGPIVTGQVINQSKIPLSNVTVEIIVKGRTGKLRLSGGQKSATATLNPPFLDPGKMGTFEQRLESGMLVESFDVIPHASSPTGAGLIQPNFPGISGY